MGDPKFFSNGLKRKRKEVTKASLSSKRDSKCCRMLSSAFFLAKRVAEVSDSTFTGLCRIDSEKGVGVVVCMRFLSTGSVDEGGLDVDVSGAVMINASTRSPTTPQMNPMSTRMDAFASLNVEIIQLNRVCLNNPQKMLISHHGNTIEINMRQCLHVHGCD